MRFPRPARVAVAFAAATALVAPPTAAAARADLPYFLPMLQLFGGVETPAKPVKRARPAKPKGRTSPPANARRRRPPRATGSFYVRSVSPAVLRQRGCRAGRLRTFGIVILAFGKPAYDGHSYGTITFVDRFASNAAITRAMKAFARGYAGCLPRRSRARIVLGRGTSNYRPHVPSPFQAGRRWARETVALARFLRRAGLADRVRSAAADDVEPAWDPPFRRTRDFFRGYRSYRPGYPLYNYGSLDGGVGEIWNARQVWYVTAGMKYVRALPQIYFPGMAEQWAHLSRIGVRRYGRPVMFAGVMTQRQAGCRCGYRPREAHRALLRALAVQPRTRLARLPAMTNIRWPS